MVLGFRIAAVGLALAAALGCNAGKTFSGPTVDAFTGKVVADGKPVSFPPAEVVLLQMTHQATAKLWGIPLQADGTFKIGWMPIGTYTCVLERPPKSHRSGPNRYNLPGPFEIVAGQTEYTIDLGKGYKP
jgi:hypothetical protein